MGAMIVIQPHEGSSPEMGVNMICPASETVSDKKDGEEVNGTYSGKIVDHDGEKYISIHQIDGQDVQEMESGQEPDKQDETEMDSNDALDSFMKNRKK
jgi:hypothetical protein